MMAKPMPEHDGAHVGEVAVDEARCGDDIADALHALAQDVVGHAEGFEEAGLRWDEIHEPVIGNGDDRIHGGVQFGEALFGLAHAARPFERERLGDYGDGERAEFLGEGGDDGCGAGAGASPEAGGDKDHVGAFEDFDDAVGVLEGGLAADLGIRAGAEAVGDALAEGDFVGGLRGAQRLRVGVEDVELDA
jgi:hypothetical protein